MVVISEGPLHALAFAASKSSTPSKFTSVVRSLPLPDVLVILEVRPEVAVARARNRAGKPELRPDEAPRVNDIYQSAARAIADEVPGKVVWCDSEALQPPQAAQRVLQSISIECRGIVGQWRDIPPPDNGS